jgi:hypothetical protein
MHDPRDRQVRYLIHFSDGGSGMRICDERLVPGAELRDGGARYRLLRVEHPPSPQGFGHAWAELVSR